MPGARVVVALIGFWATLRSWVAAMRYNSLVEALCGAEER